MIFAEVLVEMRNLSNKIEPLEKYLRRMVDSNAAQADKATTKLLGLLDKHRSHLILINKMNNATEVSIGSSKVVLANAIIITKTMKRKIDLLNALIENENGVLDVFSLMEQRDKLLEEYTTISNGLNVIEWSTVID